VNSQLFTRNRIVIALIALLAIITVASGVYAYSESQKGSLRIISSPTDATLTIGSTVIGEFEQNQSIRLAAGSHTLSLTRDEFAPYTTEVTIKKGEETSLTAQLTPLTDAARNLVLGEENVLLEGAASAEMSRVHRAITEENPLFSQLPLYTREFNAYTCRSLLEPDTETARAICVDLPDESLRENAKLGLEYVGFKLDEYETYIDTNPDDRTVLANNAFRVSHRPKASLTTPILAIEVRDQNINAQDFHNRVTASLKDAGYPLDKLELIYLDPERRAYSSNPDISL